MPSDKDRLRQAIDHIDRIKAADYPTIRGGGTDIQIVERPWKGMPEPSKLAILQDSVDWSGITNRDQAHILLGEVDPGKISDPQRNRLIEAATREEVGDRLPSPPEMKALHAEIRADEHAARVRDFGEADAATYEGRLAEASRLRGDEHGPVQPAQPPLTEAELQAVEREWGIGKADLRARADHDKPMYQVWHANEHAFAAMRIGESLGMRQPEFPMDYQLVAHVRAQDLDQVFALTNHGDEDWTRNAGVQSVTDGARSTSVGDVIVDPEGRPHRVESMGFEEIRWPPKTPTERVERHLEEMKAQSEILLESTRHYVMPDPEDAASVYDTCDSLGPWESLKPTDKLSALYELDWRGVSVNDQRRIIEREVDLSHVSREDQDRYFKDALQVDKPEVGRNTATPPDFSDILRAVRSNPPDTRSDFKRLLDEAGERSKSIQPKERDRGGPER